MNPHRAPEPPPGDYPRPKSNRWRFVQPWIVERTVGAVYEGPSGLRVISTRTIAEEDNHHPGVARHFWRPVDPAHRVACQCKETETSIQDGTYVWTNPTDGPCRGCQYAAWSGRPCPIHGNAAPEPPLCGE